VIAVDTSAIVAIALAEPEARSFGELIASEECVVGWPTVFECHQVLADVPRRRGLEVLDKILEAPGMKVVAFDQRVFAGAREAFDRFGRGRHPARLNFGDCMAYAVARVHDVPLLYKGDDFARTDIRAALP
jgi:ribonuclease VapC